MSNYEVLKTESRIHGLQIALIHAAPATDSNDYPVLFIHGATFPSALAFAFRMHGVSWMDHIAENGYDVYALDFLGYGNADRYPEMYWSSPSGKPLGRAGEIYADVDKAIDLIVQRTGKKKVYLIAHSWGGVVASLYTAKFPDKVAKLVLFAAITAREDSSGNEVINTAYEEMTPLQRVIAMKDLTPVSSTCQLEPEIFDTWGNDWLQSDTLAKKFNFSSVRFPSGCAADINDQQQGKLIYDPAEIKVPVLLIRGEWDTWPGNADEERLFALLENTPYKKYVVIEKGTHVVHLEKSRFQLYDEVLSFLRSGANGKQTNTHAIAVIFEVVPAEGKMNEYLDIALQLKPALEKIPGFISIERFQVFIIQKKYYPYHFGKMKKR